MKLSALQRQPVDVQVMRGDVVILTVKLMPLTLNEYNSVMLDEPLPEKPALATLDGGERMQRYEEQSRECRVSWNARRLALALRGGGGIEDLPDDNRTAAAWLRGNMPLDVYTALLDGLTKLMEGAKAISPGVFR